MLVKTYGSAVYGVQGITITVEVNWMATGTNYTIVGLPDNAVKESLQRVESTIKSINYKMPRTKIVVLTIVACWPNNAVAYATAATGSAIICTL